MNRLTLSSIVVGSVALAISVVAIILLILIRNHGEVVTVISPTVTPSPGEGPLPGVVNLVAPRYDALASQYLYNEGDTPMTEESALCPVLTPLDQPWTPFSVSVTIWAPGVDPDQLAFKETQFAPLQFPPQGLGWLTATPDASQVFTSLPNGFSAWGQWVYAKLPSNDPNSSQVGYVPYDTQTDSPLVKTNPEVKCNVGQFGSTNRILWQCATTDSGTQEAVNEYAAAVGCVGPRSITTTVDGLVLFVAYQTQRAQGGDPETASSLPFQQAAGNVMIYTRQPDTLGDAATTTTSSSNEWDPQCAGLLRHPHGSQLPGTSPYVQTFNEIRGRLVSGDAFGSIIRTTIHQATNKNVVAIWTQYGTLRAEGAAIYVYEDTGVGSAGAQFTLTGTVQLWSGVIPGLSGTPWSESDKTTFGWDFALGDDVLAAAVRRTSGQNAVIVYTRTSTNTWKYATTLAAPDPNQDFGASIAVAPDGDLILVGAPTRPNSYVPGASTTPGAGGAVYLYGRDPDTGDWDTTAKTTWSRSTAGEKAFGVFLETNDDFTVVAVSANTNNCVYNETHGAPQTSYADNYPTVWLASMNRTTQTLYTTKVIDVMGGATNFDNTSRTHETQEDPAFHCARLCWTDSSRGELRLFVTSPNNQVAYYFTMKFTDS